MRLFVIAAVALVATAAFAAERYDDRAVAEGSVGTVEKAPLEQPWLYMQDTRLPAPKQLVAGYALAFSSSAGAIRPVPGHFDQEGVVHTIGLQAGVVPRLTLYGTALVAQPIGHSDVGSVAVQAGARVLFTDPRAQHLRVMGEVAFLREFGADLGVVAQLTGSYDVGRVRLATTVHAEHLFARGRDPIDLYAVVGASVKLHRIVRVGAEYVVQDLEEAGDDHAEGGVRHYIGPDVALALFRNHLLVTAGSAVQLARAPGVLARAALTYVY